MATALEGALTDANLVAISNNIGTGWQSLAAFLNVSTIAVGRVMMDYMYSTKQQIYHMLLEWRDTERSNATVKSLFETMRNVDGVAFEWMTLNHIYDDIIIQNQIPAIFRKPLTNQTVYERHTITMTCELTKAYVEVCWQKDRQNIIPNNRIEITCKNCSYMLKIADATMNDGGTYTCVCRNERTECHITVIGNVLPITDDRNALMLQHDLINYYQRWFSKLAISPLIENGHFLNFLEIYVKPILLAIPSHPIERSACKPVQSYHEIFVNANDAMPYQNIYISSPAGCGKTSLAKWLTLMWCQAHQPNVSDSQWFDPKDVDEMRTFMFLFIVFLRDEYEQECDVDVMIRNQLLPMLANSATYAKLGLEFLQNLLSNVRCIIILDGLDEWNHPHGKRCKLHNIQIPYSRSRPLCTTLTTSRPWKLDVAGIIPGGIDKHLELNGLEHLLLQSLIYKVVTQLNDTCNRNMNPLKFIHILTNKKFIALSKIPVVVMQLLTLWFDNEPLGESQCEIYSNMIEFLLKRYCMRRESAIADCNRDRKIPMCLQTKTYCTTYMEIISKLATLAYNTLFTDNKESSLVFDSRIAEKYLTHTEIETILAIGILTQERVLDKISRRKSHISFIHKTFQEYFAALYVALNPGTVTQVKEKIKRVCNSIEKILEMSQIFMFLSGLCPQVMLNLHDYLRQTVSEDSRTQSYRASCELRPWRSSEARLLRPVQNTMKECLVESWLNGYDQIVTNLPVSDFFIDSPEQFSAELKSLTVHNQICSLSVRHAKIPEEVEDILNYVTVFDSIQKLWLWDVSETFVAQMVSRVSPNTWTNFECVTIVEVVNISCNILCSFVDSILLLPKSVKVRLWGCRIKQGTLDWREYIRSHPQLTVDDDVAVSADDDDWNIYVGYIDDDDVFINLFQFHTKNKSDNVPQ